MELNSSSSISKKWQIQLEGTPVAISWIGDSLIVGKTTGDVEILNCPPNSVLVSDEDLKQMDEVRSPIARYIIAKPESFGLIPAGLNKIKHINERYAIASFTSGSIGFYDLDARRVLGLVSVGRFQTWAIESQSISSNEHLIFNARAKKIDVLNFDSSNGIYDSSSGAKLSTNKTDTITSLASSANSVSCGSMNGYLSLFDLASMTQITEVHLHDKQIRALSIYERLVASGSDDNQISLTDVRTGQREVKYATDSWTTNIEFSNTGSKLIATSLDSLKYWDLRNEKELIEKGSLKISEKLVFGFSIPNKETQGISVLSEDGIVTFVEL